ncbi:MAG: DUF6691 family protein [Methylotenera sp.]
MLRKNFSAWLAGIMLGLGLILSGMTNPAKVIGFLDIAGTWDPSLMLVMVGAISVSFFAFKHAKKRTHSFLNEVIQLPKSTHVDKPLVLGAVLFGIGWGLLGICPGPALALLAVGGYKILLFILAMLLGMEMHRFLNK